MIARTCAVIGRRNSAALLMMLGLAACGGGSDGARTPGVVGDTIVIGALTPLSDPVAVIGKPLLAGLTTYFARINQEQGGVGGRYIVKILAEDIQYVNPSTGAQKYQKIKDQVAMFGLVLGTDQVNGILPLLAEDSMLAVPTTFDAEWVRDERLLPWGSPYQLQAINGVAYALTEGGAMGATVCTMTLATGYGQAVVEGVEYLAQAMNFPIAVKATFRQDDQDFVAPITQLRNAGCGVVMLGSLPSVTGKVLGAAAQVGFAPRWVATSPSWHQALAASPLRDYLVANYWSSWDGVSLSDTSEAGVRTMLAAQAAHAPEQAPDFYYYAGYVMAYPLHAMLERAVAAGDLSRAGLIAASQVPDTVLSDGIIGPWVYGSVADRNPPRSATIFRIDPADPLGLQVVRRGFSAPAAQSFTFERH
ncbi:MAG: ABC transporter substrate-binding protein [Gemmatimonadales bacterium]